MVKCLTSVLLEAKTETGVPVLLGEIAPRSRGEREELARGWSQWTFAFV